MDSFLSVENAKYITQNSWYTILILGGAVVLKLIILSLVKTVVKKIEDDHPEISRIEKRATTLASITNTVLNVVVYGAASMIILSKWGIDTRPILTGAGILGLAVGFGTQTLVRDFVTGFFILLEDQFSVGDKIKVSGVEGKVIEMGARVTKISTSEGAIHIIPNSQISMVTKLPQ